nr:hypothetical protein [Tanacetum cinerariifolium]
MSSASSAVTYTSVYTDSELGRVFWGADEELSDGGSSRVIVYGYDGLLMRPVAPLSPDYIPGPEESQTLPVPQDDDEREPMFIHLHDLDYVPEPMYPDETVSDTVLKHDLCELVIAEVRTAITNDGTRSSKPSKERFQEFANNSSVVYGECFRFNPFRQAMNTPPDDLIGTYFKQEWVVPKVMLHIFEEFVLLLGRHFLNNEVPRMVV